MKQMDRHVGSYWLANVHNVWLWILPTQAEIPRHTCYNPATFLVVNHCDARLKFNHALAKLATAIAVWLVIQIDHITRKTEHWCHLSASAHTIFSIRKHPRHSTIVIVIKASVESLPLYLPHSIWFYPVHSSSVLVAYVSFQPILHTAWPRPALSFLSIIPKSNDMTDTDSACTLHHFQYWISFRPHFYIKVPHSLAGIFPLSFPVKSLRRSLLFSMLHLTPTDSTQLIFARWVYKQKDTQKVVNVYHTTICCLRFLLSTTIHRKMSVILRL